MHSEGIRDEENLYKQPSLLERVEREYFLVEEWQDYDKPKLLDKFLTFRPKHYQKHSKALHSYKIEKLKLK
jgi:hypothetical protein